VPFQITDPERIPAQRYYDETFFKLENEHFWPHVWQMACRLEEIPRVGDWVEYKILDKSVLIVRTKTGIKAFHNSCRHRGVQFASGHGNCEKTGFVCPFHGWRWNMDGDNTFVFAREIFNPELLGKAEIALVPCRVDTWGGCAFINFDDNAPGLIESLGPVAQRLDARNVEKLKVVGWWSTILPTNWKLAMEAFMEGYHVMMTHPQLYKVTTPDMDNFGPDSGGGVNRADPKNSREWLHYQLKQLRGVSVGMGGDIGGMMDPSELAIADSLKDMELPEDRGAAMQAFYGRLNHEITTQGRALKKPVFDLNQVAATTEFHAVEFLSPHYFLLPMFTAMSSYRIRPVTPETCQFELWSLEMRPEDEERDPPSGPLWVKHDDPAVPEIPAQDYSNLPLQQLGLHAKGFEFMRLSKKYEGMISNFHRWVDGYIAGVEPSKLAVASAKVNAGFEGPIQDIGF
jgi:phenylpropionate dioxygenase-like ring-hydroxylating dioxygenase large terminal subunit